jgi:uncharacterized membrane protein (DUF106 family)
LIAMSKNRNQNAPSGGSRLITYILIALIVFFVGYYVVLPAFTPRGSTTTTGTSSGTSSATISLDPSTDVSGASVTVVGQKLPASTNVTITFDGTQLPLTNSTSGHTYCKTTSAGALSGCTFWVPPTGSGSHQVNVTAGMVSIEKNFNIPHYTPPVSTVLVTLTSVSLGVITQVVTRRVVDLNAERKMRAEVSAFNKEKREATLAKDKAKLDKLKKREMQVQQEQFKVQRNRLKVTAITFVPLLGVYYLMATFLGGYGVIVAYTPIPIPDFAGLTQQTSVFQVSLFWWYFLSSFTFSTMLTRVFHTST